MSDLPLRQKPHAAGSGIVAIWAIGCLCLSPLIGCDSAKTDTSAPAPGSVGSGERVNSVESALDSKGKPVDNEQPATERSQLPSKRISGVSQIQAPIDGGGGDGHELAIPIQYATWEEILVQVQSSGKPAVVDVWSLACEPCMKEFPGLVKLQQEYGDKLNCVSANVNYDGRRSHPPESYATDIIRFLTFQEANLNNYICSTASDLVFETLEIPSIPAVLLFDAEGNEVARFVDAGETRGFTYEKNIMPAVAELLGQSAQQDPAAEQVEQTAPVEQAENETPSDTESDSSDSPRTPLDQ